MASYIARRKFLATLGGAAAWPLAARAQQASKLPTIGFLGAATASVAGQWFAAFVKRLHELGCCPRAGRSRHKVHPRGS